MTLAYQGEQKKALVELSPFSWDGSRLWLARKLRVRLAFRGREIPSKVKSHRKRGVVAHLVTVERGLYAVSLQELLGRRRARTSKLRLSRQGNSVPYHIEGDMFYFWSEGERANPYGREAVYELELGASGETMEVVDSATSPRGTFHWHTVQREENRYYQATLVNAPDVWLWDVLFAPERKSFGFESHHLAAASVSEPSRLELWLQGTSDIPGVIDHHVRVYVNGSFIADAHWDGKNAYKLAAEVGPGVVREGENELEIENVGDTGATYSMIMLDRFRLEYPRAWSALDDAVHVIELGDGDDAPRWATSDGLRHDGRYEAILSALRPGLRTPTRGASRLKRARRQTDYLVIGPESFLGVASPLLAHRREQGLRVRTASIEDIGSAFGYGELSPEAVRDFIAYAYHEWRAPSLRYVLLLGDATYDFKDALGTGVTNQVPPFMMKTSYLWTASDPAYAAVNGDDMLPDVAIGRLPARSAEELRVMINKIIAFETGERSEDAPFVLIADDADEAGSFARDAEEIASTLLATRTMTKIYLDELGTTSTRASIRQSFDDGASLVSYLGHGAIHLWAGENLFNSGNVSALSPQSRQPLVLTMNCLNGYFHFPYFDSLAEALVKAEGKGAIAAFSPSGLSVNAPAHRYHQAILRELLSGEHTRLGDAVLAAQKRYADTGAFPELLSIYHLFGDPALRLDF